MVFGGTHTKAGGSLPPWWRPSAGGGDGLGQRPARPPAVPGVGPGFLAAFPGVARELPPERAQLAPPFRRAWVAGARPRVPPRRPAADQFLEADCRAPRPPAFRVGMGGPRKAHARPASARPDFTLPAERMLTFALVPAPPRLGRPENQCDLPAHPIEIGQQGRRQLGRRRVGDPQPPAGPGQGAGAGRAALAPQGLAPARPLARRPGAAQAGRPPTAPTRPGVGPGGPSAPPALPLGGRYAGPRPRPKPRPAPAPPPPSSSG